MKQEKNAYILGTERAELHRLGVQHQVWSSEAREAWKYAEFGNGDRILDLGCGPGYCSMELAYMVGEGGKVIGVDKSQAYIDFIQASADLHGLKNMELQCADFDDMKLKTQLDGVYCRWALAWIPNPEEIIQKVVDAMQPGAAFVAQEYYDWTTFQTQPELPALKKAVKMAYKSMKKGQAGDIDIGRRLPSLFADAGLEVIRIRPMTKMTTPDDFTWQWPYTFLNIYIPKLKAYLSKKEIKAALEELDELSWTDMATILCPHMVEVVGVKS